MKETTGNHVRFLAGLARRRSSLAGAGAPARRRLAGVCSAVLTAGVAAAAFTTVGAAAASASTVGVSVGWCLDANAGQVYDGGEIEQYGCNPYDQYQEWTTTPDSNTPYGTTYQLQNVGAFNFNVADDCLDANAGQAYNGGEIEQYGCDTGDPFQQWLPTTVDNEFYQWENYGDLLYYHQPLCLDAYGGQQYNGGGIIQYACNPNDMFQSWKENQALYSINGSPSLQLFITPPQEIS